MDIPRRKLMKNLLQALAGAGLLLALAAPAPVSAQATTQAAPTVEEARKFLDEAQKRLLDLSIDGQRAQWVQENFITYDTEILSAAANEALLAAGVDYAQQAARFDNVQLPQDLRRQIDLIKRGLVLAPPSDPAKTAELSRLAASLSAQYGSGKVCPPGGGECKTLPDLEELMRVSRNPKALLDAWVGWHSVAPAMRADYVRLVEIANEGARDLGYKDTGVLWRAKYDMAPDAFAADLDRLWGQVKPLYDSLHCYVRAQLNKKYGGSVVPLDKPIPAHLLGNMWSQSWVNIYDLVAPPNADPGYDLTKALEAKKTDPAQMAKYAESFFVSLGFAPLPQTFWERSLLSQPRDRDVVCHASAWDIDYKDDLRVKACLRTNDVDFRTIHHEEGHNFYQRAYNKLPFLYQDSANDGFHEAVGDTIALSITPDYLKQVGLISQVPDPSKDLGPDVAGRLQQGLVGAAHEVPGDHAAGAPLGEGFRRGREVPRAGEHPLHALLPGGHPPVPAPPRALPGGRLQGSPAPLLDLRQQGGGSSPGQDAGDGRQPPLARRPGGRHRPAPDGRHRHPRLLRPLEDLARPAEQGPEVRLVR
jgi:peptidyl-dipeptidase A